MSAPSYVFRRRESGVFFFRWRVPASYRDWFEGKQEIKHSLRTTNRGLAVRVARRLLTMLDRDILRRMAAGKNDKGQSTWGLSVKLFEQLINGTVRLEGVEMSPDPAHAEEERKHLAALVGMKRGPQGAAAMPEGVKLSEVITAFMAERKSGKNWTEKTAQDVQRHLDLFAQIVGANTPITKLDRKELARFKDVVMKLPRHRSISPLYKGKTALELAGMSIPAAHRAQPKTVNKALGWVGALLEYAKDNGHIALNPASGLAVKISKRADEEREAYTDQEVRTIIDAAISGAHGADRASYMRWVPLIGAYTGARIEEICQLAVADFKEVDGIPVMEVTDQGEGQKVKTVNARRTIPIHPALIDAGLLSHVKALRAKGTSRLYPELSRSRDGYSAIPSKWFARFRKRLGLGKTFHSLRHSVSSKLREADVPEDLVSELLGHRRSQKETFGRYAKAASVKRLHEALSKLSYEAALP